MMRRQVCVHTAAWVLAAALVSGGCSEAVEPRDYGDPTGQSRPTSEDGIVAYVVSPAASVSPEAPVVELVIAAFARGAVPLRVHAGTAASGAIEATRTGAPGPSARYRVKVPLLHGANDIEIAVASDDAKLFRRLSHVVVYEGAAPGVAFELLGVGPGGGCEGATPLDGGYTNREAVCARGLVTAASGRTIESVAVSTDAGAQAKVEVGDDGRFEVAVAVALDAEVVVTGKVSDSAGAKGSWSRKVVQSTEAPGLVVTSPAMGKVAYTDATNWVIEGEATASNGLAGLQIDAVGGYSVAAAPVSPFQVEVQLVPGKNAFSVVARDRAGNEAKAPVTVVRNRVFRLAAQQANQGSTTLALDRAALSGLISEADQKTIEMAEVPLRPAIQAALEAIRDPVGKGVDVSKWGQAEKNMSRLLDMSPDSADLAGSSVEELLGISAGVGLPPPRMLADLLGIDVITPVVDLSVATDVILEQVVATHPDITLGADGKPALRVTTYDVLQDLHTLGPRFGPSGNHPGFLEGETEAKVLQSGFQMSLPVRSNLTRFDGVDASADERAALYKVQGDQVLELDFASDDFSIVGLADEPKIDLRMKVVESHDFMKVGVSKQANADPTRPGFYRGDGQAWALSPWQIERVVAEIAYRQYVERFAPTYEQKLTYDAGSIQNAAVVEWSRGWVTLTTAGGIGSPPAPQYVWDLLNETAQIRLHDGGIAEGEANLGFVLEGLPIGLTAEQLIAKVKPSLQAQSSKISKLIAGSSGLAGSGADFFFVARVGGGGWLFFRAPGDASGPYAYKQPGFFADAGLSTKVSSTAAAQGTDDTAHEKLEAKPGVKAYFRDDTSTVYEVEVMTVAIDGVDVRVKPALGGGS